MEEKDELVGARGEMGLSLYQSQLLGKEGANCASLYYGL